MHSPKPWSVGSNFIYDADDRSIVEFCTHSPADAALIAAAPDLLEACKAALRMDNTIVENDEHYLLDSETRSLIESAIAKAEST